MKHLILFLVSGMLLLASGTRANEIVFICKNVDGKEREFELKIDLDKKTLKRPGNPYKIVEILENEIIAKRSYKLGDVTGEMIWTFNRTTGNLNYKNLRSTTLYDSANHFCNKRLI